MSLAEKVVKEHVTRTPERYAARVRWMAVIYLTLNIISVAIIVAIVWRVQFFVTLAQRSNIETLTLAIIFILAIYYIFSTFRGFTGSLKMLFLNVPRLWRKEEEVEWKKHRAIRTGGEPKSAYFDQAITLEGKPDEPIVWQVGDDTAKLGEIEVKGVEAMYHPIKDGMNDSLFEFLADKLEEVMQKQDLNAKVQVVQWSEIDEDQAAVYHSTVQAFQSLEKQLGKGPIWPTAEISQEDYDYIQGELRRLVPALRNESMLPDVEYEVEYSVPVLPEPLGFLRLTRRENRADPVITMGCASFVMLFVMALLVLFIILPPWVPSK